MTAALELARQGVSKRQIQLAVYGYAGGAAYHRVSQVLAGGTTVSDSGEMVDDTHCTESGTVVPPSDSSPLSRKEATKADGGAKIALRQVTEIDAELHHNRLVQTLVAVEALTDLSGGFLAEYRLAGVPGDCPGQGKGDHQDPKQYGNRGQ